VLLGSYNIPSGLFVNVVFISFCKKKAVSSVDKTSEIGKSNQNQNTKKLGKMSTKESRKSLVY
jgi:hypothetical protein